ncbi:MAG: hypothetical protein LJE95_12230 [Acidobacteria bacterium]|nr:hypothetical protein [Acidobacteriota bacterium]
MGNPGPHATALDAFLLGGLRRPLHLSSSEVSGGWRELFPDLARVIPGPYPIYSPDESRIVLHGYPIRLSELLQRICSDLRDQIPRELSYRARTDQGEVVDKGAVMEGRKRLVAELRAVMGNAILSDSGRGLYEILILYLSREIARLVHSAHERAATMGTDPSMRSFARRFQVATVVADLLQRSANDASDHIRAMARTTRPPHRSPLLAEICLDLLPLAFVGPPVETPALADYISLQYRVDGAAELGNGKSAIDRLAELLSRHRELSGALHAATHGQLDLSRPSAVFEPRLWAALRAMELLGTLAVPEKTAALLSDLGVRLKRLELVTALRRGVVEVSSHGPHLEITSQQPTISIASSTRPFDFARPGVVDSTIRRFGLVYDLTRFTETLEAVRKEGRRAEERALRFMYIFQHRLEEIRIHRRLIFEKYLGDGAFYSARRALRVLAAACEIQRLYDQLREDGFPFDRGIRMAMNFGTYHLLAMEHVGPGQVRYEFFGHGVVELARLTTGKSAREVEEIAEFLIHSGYSPTAVDHFLAPLLRARGGEHNSTQRPHEASLDAHGELINEGIVLTTPFLTELKRELDESESFTAADAGEQWLGLTLRESDLPPEHVGLRRLGVARLKGLSPLELIEAMPWQAPPTDSQPVPMPADLLAFVRRLAAGEDGSPRQARQQVPEDLVVVTYLDGEGCRRWVFGRYRDSDDVLLSAVEASLTPPDMGRGEPLETWLFRNRGELTRLYEGLLKTSQASSLPLHSLRLRDGYLGCFLAAPHRSPA